MAGTIQLQDTHFYRQFWLEPVPAEPGRAGLLAPFEPGLEAEARRYHARLLERLLPVESLRNGPLAGCVLDVALAVEAPVPVEVSGVTRGVLRPDALYLAGTGAEPRLVGKLAFGRARPGGGAGGGGSAPAAVLPGFTEFPLPLEEGILYLDPAGLAESTVLFPNLPVLGGVAATSGAGARRTVVPPGNAVFAPIDRVPVWILEKSPLETGGFTASDGEAAATAASDGSESGASLRAPVPGDPAAGELALGGAAEPMATLFPETDPVTGRRVRFFRLEIR